MLRTAALFALSLTIASPLAAQSLRVEGRVTASAVPGGFAVNGGGGNGARGMWCGAASYASRVLGAGSSQRIYVAEGSGRNRGVFTLSSKGLTPSTVSILGSSIRTPGANLSVAHAQSFCADFRINNGR